MFVKWKDTMDRQAAVKIIKDTFESSFDKGQFIKFSKNLLKHIDESSFVKRIFKSIPNDFYGSLFIHVDNLLTKYVYLLYLY